MNGKIAIVTGGSRGIGRAICLAFAERGATVIACARNKSALIELAEEAKKRERSGVIEPTELDVSDRSAIDPMVAAVAEKHSRIDILVNNSGNTR